MRWRDKKSSKNVEDRTGNRGGGGFSFPGGGMRFPSGGRGRGGLGLGTIVIIGIVCLVLGINPLEMLFGGGSAPQPQVTQQRSPTSVPPSTAKPTGSGELKDTEVKAFLGVVLNQTEEVWHKIFAQKGLQYRPAGLVLYSRGDRSGCGPANSAFGPFYCPLDGKVYIDPSFYREMRNRFKAPGDFAQAYILAHEVGHHIQNLRGTLGKLQKAQQRTNKLTANKLQVLAELQADCYAGLWANHANTSSNILEPGDIEEGLRAASAVGDDTIQRRTTGYVKPENFTHGTAAQRKEWFMKGYRSGNFASCDTFSAAKGG